MTSSTSTVEEHELPCVEAVLAGTMALMTGYSQALQAELHPRQRIQMGEKIGDSLALLVQHPQLSLGFRQVLLGLQSRWQAMRACSQQADCDMDCDLDLDRDGDLKPEAHDQRPAHARFVAPERLQ